MSNFLKRVNGLALQASQRSDVIIAAFMMLAITMIVIPLPTPMVDTLIGMNIAFSLLILIVAFYISHPVDFSALPPIILLATLFRLALSITTTRLILLQADAGQIVSTFGSFVIAGQVTIGLVVFFIIAIAQFLVITKGSERVAEVAARFVLDAMPGKQMSIDNDIRNGDIDATEGRRRRDRLERESQLYGAMDGAMKFVKGDAIAVLIILFINLIGGLLVGMFQHNMPFGEAIRTYSTLTVGDGLIAQIPALLISVGAGTVVTRVSSENSGDLGAEIVSQLGNSDRALGLTAFILFAIAFVPGFTPPVFLTLSAGLAVAAWAIWRKRQKLEAEEQEQSSASAAESGADSEHPSSNDYRILLSLGASLWRDTSSETLAKDIETVRYNIGRALGINVPSIGHAIDPKLDDNGFDVELDGVPVLKAQIPAGQILARSDIDMLEMLELEYTTQTVLPKRPAMHWVAAEKAATLAEAGVEYTNAEQVLCDALDHVIRHYAAELVGIQETRELLAGMEESYSDLVSEATSSLTPPQTAEILRRLVEEGVSVRPLRTLLEALAEWGPQDQDPVVLTERVRAALARRICHQHARRDRVLPAWTLTRQLEEVLFNTVQRASNNGLGGMPEPLSKSLLAQFNEQIGQPAANADRVLMVSSALRRALYEWCRRQELAVSVMAWSELATEFELQSLGSFVHPDEDTSEELSLEHAAAANQ